MMTLYTQSEELVVVRCWCGMSYAVPATLRGEQLRTSDENSSSLSLYCPLGHSWVVGGKSKVDLLNAQLTAEKTRLTAEKARHDQTRAELRETENRRRAEKAAKQRLRNRVAAGVCPCCKRSFTNLRRHMSGQHPDFKEKP